MGIESSWFDDNLLFAISNVFLFFAVARLGRFTQVLSDPGLGSDSRGMRSSLQVVVGEANERGVARVYSDLDCVNPAEGAAPFLMHGVPIAVKRSGRFFRRIFR